MKPQFFKTAADFRKWLEKNHKTAQELWIGYYKKATGRPSITHAEAVDEALCFGWIDGIRKGIDEESYTNRFTPRKAGSNWSRINIARVAELTRDGRMRKAGLDAFEARDKERPSSYSFEQRDDPHFTPEMEKKFRANKPAWKFWEAQPPGYRRLMTFYVVSAKKD
ncbi:MAG TPA: YdeI/OmpD-associated family protein, partial [Thermoanaerobaculia bacterium]